MAYLDFKVKQVYLETRDSQDFEEKRVNMVFRVLDFQARLVQKESVEFRELQDYQESQDDQDRTARLETLVYLDKKVNLDEVFQVQKVHREKKELRVSRDRRVTSGCLVFLGERDRQDYLDLKELKVILGPQDLLDWLVRQDLQGKAHLEPLDHRVHLGSLEHLVGKV